MKKSEEVYSRMKAMYLRPHVVPPQVTRRSKTTPTMADYISKQANRNSGASKTPFRLPVATARSDHASNDNFANLASNVTTKDMPLETASARSDEMETQDSTGRIDDVIGQKPSAQTLKELNTPLVPNVERERSKGVGSKASGTIRMKNIGSPKSECDRL